MKLIILEPNPARGPWYGLTNRLVYRPNRKHKRDKLRLPHEHEFVFGWPKLIALAGCLAFCFGLAWVIQR